MVTLKLARTADGFAAGDEHDRRLAITGEIANRRVQTLRAMHEAIMVGVGTALGDDPLLTVRQNGLDQRPLRVVLDSALRLPLESRLAATAAQFPTLVIAGAGRAGRARGGFARARHRGRAGRGHRVDLGEALRGLGGAESHACFSEGGPTVGSALIRAGLADEVLLFTAEKPLGRQGPPGAGAGRAGGARRPRAVSRRAGRELWAGCAAVVVEGLTSVRAENGGAGARAGGALRGIEIANGAVGRLAGGQGAGVFAIEPGVAIDVMAGRRLRHGR